MEQSKYPNDKSIYNLSIIEIFFEYFSLQFSHNKLNTEHVNFLVVSLQLTGHWHSRLVIFLLKTLLTPDLMFETFSLLVHSQHIYLSFWNLKHPQQHNITNLHNFT